MPSNLLNDTALRRAKPRDKEYELSDGDGLTFRVRTNGQRAWIWRYTSPTTGKRAKMYIGAYPALPLAAARELRDRRRELVQKGVDPKNATGLLDDMGDEIPETLSQLFATWHAKEVAISRARAEDRQAIKSRYQRYVQPVAGDVALNDLRRAHIMKALEGPRKARRLRTTNILLAELRQMIGYAVTREWMQGDPSAAIKRRDAGGRDNEGERVLDDDELRTVRDVCGRPPVQKTRYYTATRRVLPVRSELAVWWTLATAARAVEVATIRRQGSVDKKERTWTIPAAVAKNGRAHVVHLSDFALAVWERMEALPAQNEYVFADRDGVGHMSEKEVTKRLTDRQTREKPIKGRKNNTDLDLPGGRWTQHDLRRTASTIMGENDVTEGVIDRCLNHVIKKKVTRTYQRQQMLPQRRAAFDVLGNYLTQVLGDPRAWLPRP